MHISECALGPVLAIVLIFEWVYVRQRWLASGCECEYLFECVSG